MRPELQVAGLPSFRAAVEVRPRAAGRAGVRVSGVALAGEGLVFRAEGGGLASGLYREEPEGGLELLLADEGDALVEPLVRHDVVIAKRIAAGGAPAWPRAIRFFRQASAPLDVPGQSVGVSGDGRVALVVDVVGRRLRRVSLADLGCSEVGQLTGGMDPQLAPLVSLDYDGRRALFMDAREERGDASLESLDLDSGEGTRLLGPLPAPSFVTAAYLPDAGGERGVVALVVELKGGPRARLLVLDERGSRDVWRADVTQPASVPCVLDENTVAMPLSLKPHGPASYGPVDLVAVSLQGKSPTPLTRSGEVVGQARLVDEAVVVEGGPALLRVHRA